eukprot:PhF_6_TR11247/c0_g1_i2/m.18140
MGNSASCNDCGVVDACGLDLIQADKKDTIIPEHVSILGFKWLSPNATQCPLCCQDFTFFHRKHYCRRCAVVVCIDCSSNYVHLAGTEGPSRVCDRCYPSLRRNILKELSSLVWWRILEFIDLCEAGKVLYTCHTTLNRGLCVPYKWVPDWNDVFQEDKTFINEGAYGKVYKTKLRDPKIFVGDVAVKCIKKTNLVTLKQWRAVVREIEVHRRIAHPTSIQMIDVFHDDNNLYLVLEYARGGDLFDWVVKQNKTLENVAQHITRSLFEFCHYLYQDLHIVHRDFKLENILIMEDTTGLQPNDTFQIKVADYGLAKFLQAPADPTALQGAYTVRMLAFDVGGRSGFFATPCGTIGYTAPEVLHPGSKLKPKLARADCVHKLDVFSIGVIMHILLTGAEPYPASNLRDHLRKAALGIRTTDRVYKLVSADAKALLRTVLGAAATRPTALEILQTPYFKRKGSDPETIPAIIPPSPQSSPVLMPATESEFLKHAQKLVRMKEIVYDVTRDGVVVMRQLKQSCKTHHESRSTGLRGSVSTDDLHLFAIQLPDPDSPHSLGNGVSDSNSVIHAQSPSPFQLNSRRNMSPVRQVRSKRHMSVNMGNISSQKRRQEFLSTLYSPYTVQVPACKGGAEGANTAVGGKSVGNEEGS